MQKFIWSKQIFKEPFMMNRSSLPQKRRPPNSLGEHRKSSAAKFGIISALIDSIQSIPTWNFQVAFNRKSVFFAF